MMSGLKVAGGAIATALIDEKIVSKIQNIPKQIIGPGYMLLGFFAAGMDKDLGAGIVAAGALKTASGFNLAKISGADYSDSFDALSGFDDGAAVGETDLELEDYTDSGVNGTQDALFGIGQDDLL